MKLVLKGAACPSRSRSFGTIRLYMPAALWKGEIHTHNVTTSLHSLYWVVLPRRPSWCYLPKYVDIHLPTGVVICLFGFTQSRQTMTTFGWSIGAEQRLSLLVRPWNLRAEPRFASCERTTICLICKLIAKYNSIAPSMKALDFIKKGANWNLFLIL
jgi:hypothetical protein